MLEWLLPESTKLIFNTGNSLAQLANFALCSHIASQNSVLQCRHQPLPVRPNLRAECIELGMQGVKLRFEFGVHRIKLRLEFRVERVDLFTGRLKSLRLFSTLLAITQAI